MSPRRRLKSICAALALLLVGGLALGSTPACTTTDPDFEQLVGNPEIFLRRGEREEGHPSGRPR